MCIPLWFKHTYCHQIYGTTYITWHSSFSATKRILGLDMLYFFFLFFLETVALIITKAVFINNTSYKNVQAIGLALFHGIMSGLLRMNDSSSSP